MGLEYRWLLWVYALDGCKNGKERKHQRRQQQQQPQQQTTKNNHNHNHNNNNNNHHNNKVPFRVWPGDVLGAWWPSSCFNPSCQGKAAWKDDYTKCIWLQPGTEQQDIEQFRIGLL